MCRGRDDGALKTRSEIQRAEHGMHVRWRASNTRGGGGSVGDEERGARADFNGVAETTERLKVIRLQIRHVSDMLSAMPGRRFFAENYLTERNENNRHPMCVHVRAHCKAV